MLTRISALIFTALALLASANAQPTISGVNAFWYLGPLPSGVYSDGGSCSGQSGPCYYTQSALSATPSSGSGYTWYVSNQARVTLSCYSNCSSSVTATANSASSGCSSDVYVTATYGGQVSSDYGLTIVTPNSATLSSGYPYDGPNPTYGNGSFQTEYNWEIYDSCGNQDTGLDQNEGFCSPPDDDGLCAWTNDYSGNNWNSAEAQAGYMSSVFVDYMSQNVPYGTPSSYTPSTGYDTCSTSTPVLHAPWTGYVGSQSDSCSGVDSCGAQVLSNTFQFYTDCGRHQ